MFEFQSENDVIFAEVDVEKNLDVVKAEMSLLEDSFLRPTCIIKTEPEEEDCTADLVDEDFALDSLGCEDANDIDLKEFVICPSESEEPGDTVESMLYMELAC